MKSIIYQLLDHIEEYICQILLVFFVGLLFIQIVLGWLGHPLSWSEELARFAFVWFVFFSATHAARLSAHNRVTVQFKLVPEWFKKSCLLIADGIWILFNGTLVWQSLGVIEVLQTHPYETPACQWQLWVVYCIFPIAFTLMSIRIVQVNCIEQGWLREPARNITEKTDGYAISQEDPLGKNNQKKRQT